ncbi:hypothetical protein ABZP36_022623 [Zizania latifolia]
MMLGFGCTVTESMKHETFVLENPVGLWLGRIDMDNLECFVFVFLISLSVYTCVNLSQHLMTLLRVLAQLSPLALLPQLTAHGRTQGHSRRHKRYLAFLLLYGNTHTHENTCTCTTGYIFSLWPQPP